MFVSIIIKLIINLISLILLFLFSLWYYYFFVQLIQDQKFIRRVVWWIWKCIIT